MHHSRTPCSKAVFFLAVFSLFLSMEASPEKAAALGEGQKPGSEEAPKRDPMDTEGLKPKLSRVLTNYYLKTFTGPENWAEIESVMFVGVLQTPQGKLYFSAYKKKPDLSKVVIRSPDRDGRLVFAYDGKEAWQLNGIGSTDPRPESMPPDEAKNFIRDATIGGHLLDPLKEGKQIEITGVVEVDNRTCYEIEVTLPDGQRILSAIDIVDYAELRQITTNHVNDTKEANFFSDFRGIDGLRFPFASVMRSNGEEVHRVEMSKIWVNPGLTEGIFKRPPAAPVFDAESSAPENESFDETRPGDFSVNPFGEAPFDGSSFPDPEEIQGEPLLDETLIP